MGPLRIVPCTAKAAQRWILETHRHLPRVGMSRFAAAVATPDGVWHGVAIVGNGPRVWEGSTRAVITRCATDGTPNACSILYGALCRAARVLGYTEVWTYTLPEEPGTSLRAAGFSEAGLSAGGEHDRPSRRRAAAVRPEPKRRWVRYLLEATRGGSTALAAPASADVGVRF